eukprot:358836-Chlamydomonas_euryale.AAC.4
MFCNDGLGASAAERMLNECDQHTYMLDTSKMRQRNWGEPCVGSNATRHAPSHWRSALGAAAQLPTAGCPIEAAPQLSFAAKLARSWVPRRSRPTAA